MDTTNRTSNTNWTPRSGREEIAGCVWLPRMLDKARRKVESERVGRDVLYPYIFGGIDPLDNELKAFLRTTDEDVLELVRREPDNQRVADELVQRSGRTPEECAAWSEAFRRKHAFDFATFDADEGRRAPGLTTTLLRVFYNYIVMPPVYWLVRRDERQRANRASARNMSTL